MYNANAYYTELKIKERLAEANAYRNYRISKANSRRPGTRFARLRKTLSNARSRFQKLTGGNREGSSSPRRSARAECAS